MVGAGSRRRRGGYSRGRTHANSESACVQPEIVPGDKKTGLTNDPLWRQGLQPRNHRTASTRVDATARPLPPRSRPTAPPPGPLLPRLPPPARCRAGRCTAPPRSGTAGRLLDASGCRGTTDGRRRATPEAPIIRPALMPAAPSAYVTLRLASFRVTSVATAAAAVDLTVISLGFRHLRMTGEEVAQIDAVLDTWQSAAFARVDLVVTVRLGVHVDCNTWPFPLLPFQRGQPIPPHARWHPSGTGEPVSARRYQWGHTFSRGRVAANFHATPYVCRGCPMGAFGAGPDTRNRGVAEASRSLTRPGSPAKPARAPPRRRRAAVGWPPH